MKKTASIACIAALLLTACQTQESPAPTVESVPLIFGDNPTKADVDGNDGTTTWTSGDKVAVYISGSGADAYQEKTVDVSTSKIPISLTSVQSRANYAIYPSASAVSGYTTEADLRVTYPSTYDLSSLAVDDLDTFSPMPMVAVNSTGALTFYNVGGVLRLSIANVPSTAKQIRVTVPGMNIYGEYTVTAPSTTAPYVTTTSGSSASAVTLTLPTLAATTNLTLNLPLPTGDYSGVTDDKITVEALTAGGASTVASITGSVKRWSTISRRKGKKLSVDFGSATISITSSAATIWKGQTTTYDASSTGSGITWASSDESVATVNASGVITAVAAGTANITASTNGGLVTSDPVAVYVNAVTGITMSPTSKTIAPSGSATLTATLDHTSNGSIASYPSVSVSWSSANTDYVTVSSASSTASYTDDSYKATMTVSGVSLGGPYDVTAQISGNDITSSASVSAICAVTVKEVTSITLPGDSYKYKFRGYYVHPGVLFWDGSSFSLTDGSDPLELLQHYYYDSRTTKFGGTSGTAWVNACYFTWTELSTRLGVNGSGVITGTVSAVNPATGGDAVAWRVPTTGSSSGEWYTIYYGTPSSGITINSSTYTSRSANNIFVNVNLSDAPAAYQNKGLGYNNNTTSNAAGSKGYQSGMLLVPDGATITCSRIRAVPGNSSATTSDSYNNAITYDDLRILTDGGCVFLPCAGLYYGSSWDGGGGYGRSWSASPDGGDAYRLGFNSNAVFIGSNNKSYYFPVRLLRE